MYRTDYWGTIQNGRSYPIAKQPPPMFPNHDLTQGKVISLTPAGAICREQSRNGTLRSSKQAKTNRGKSGKIAHLTFRRTKMIINTKASIRN